MKKQVFNLLVLAVVTTLTALTSCDKNDELSYRVVSDGIGHQTIYADETKWSWGLTAGVGTFVWWTSWDIVSPAENSWIISITPESGARPTNKCAFVINVEPNTSGIDREAVLLMHTLYTKSNEVLIDRIYFRQLATTMEGQLYKVPELNE